MKKNIWSILLIFSAIIIGIIVGNIIAGNNINSKISNFLSSYNNAESGKINELMSLINYDYVDDVQLDSLTDEVMAEIISKLDPHSVYIPAKDLDDVNSELEGSFSGIGVQFNIQNDTVMVISVINGGPSEKMGLLAGDRIVYINDSLFVGKQNVSNEKVMKKLRGVKGTKVKVGIRRNGTSDILNYTITRGDIPVNTVLSAYIIAPEIGFIGLNNNFSATTYNEFIHAIAELKQQGAKKFIIDLRGNSGGLMDIAIKMLNEFLEKDNLIVYSEGKSYSRTEAKANGSGTCIKNPIVVLIDEFSASASEIFAGAIQDNDRGLIIGRRSFGKGLIQTQIPFSDGSAVRLTVARYFTPSGRSIQKPYTKGKLEDYAKDIYNRFEHGEFDNKDSIQFVDSLVFKTLKGRKVYGGGGIMPDIFIPRDTTLYSGYFNEISNLGYINQFAFRYADQNRQKLKNFKTNKELANYLTNQNILSQFTQFTVEKGIKPNQHDIAISKSIIEHRIKSIIIQNILGDKEFYPFYNQDDITILRAIEEIKKVNIK
jgi:carboxyl-terminal processing protease